jgi:hypothetical protein
VTDDAEHPAIDVAQVVERYQRHVNAGLAALFRFMGFDAVEARAEGSLISICSPGSARSPWGTDPRRWSRR